MELELLLVVPNDDDADTLNGNNNDATTTTTKKKRYHMMVEFQKMFRHLETVEENSQTKVRDRTCDTHIAVCHDMRALVGKRKPGLMTKLLDIAKMNG